MRRQNPLFQKHSGTNSGIGTNATPNSEVKLRTADELLEYRFENSEGCMSYRVEKGVLYAAHRYEKDTFWRVSLHVGGMLPAMSEIQLSDYLAKMLNGRSEVVPVRVAYGDDRFSIPFGDCCEGQMTSDLDSGRAENANQVTDAVV